jgi:hypothetical protein
MSDFRANLTKEPYLLINIIFTGVIIAILIYSGIFSPDKDNYPVVCFHQKITGMPCASCGLSHSFSLILRGRISEAYLSNIYGMRIFLFFALQMVLRAGFSLFYTKNKNTGAQLITYDITASIVLFIIAFYPFIKQLVVLIFTAGSFAPNH